jgi:hypothetical protein
MAKKTKVLRRGKVGIPYHVYIDLDAEAERKKWFVDEFNKLNGSRVRTYDGILRYFKKHPNAINPGTRFLPNYKSRYIKN